jgi:hypothetical protein
MSISPKSRLLVLIAKGLSIETFDLFGFDFSYLPGLAVDTVFSLGFCFGTIDFGCENYFLVPLAGLLVVVL